MSPTFDMFVPKNMFPQPGGAPGNKTGTLNTKSVTASMLATDSPILPHKLNGSYTQQVEDCFQIFFMDAWNFCHTQHCFA